MLKRIIKKKIFTADCRMRETFNIFLTIQMFSSSKKLNFNKKNND